MWVRPFVPSAPLLGRRRDQCLRACDLLGARHPLVHVMDDIRVMAEQSVVVTAMLAAGLSAVLAGVSEAGAVVVAALLVQGRGDVAAGAQSERQARPRPGPHRRGTRGRSAAVRRTRTQAAAGSRAARSLGACAGCRSRRGHDNVRAALLTSPALLPACRRRRRAGARRNRPGAAARRCECARGRAERAAPERSRLAALRERRRSAARAAPVHPVPAREPGRDRARHRPSALPLRLRPP